MLEVLKNLGKLLAVAVLAGILGALGGFLINSFTDKPKSPASTTLPKPAPTRPEPPAAVDREAEEETRPEQEDAVSPGEQEEEAPAATEKTAEGGSETGSEPSPAETTTEPSPPPATSAPAALPPPKAAPAPEPKEPAKPGSDKPAGKSEPGEAEEPQPGKKEPAQPPAPDKAADKTKDKTPAATAEAPSKPTPPPAKAEASAPKKKPESSSFDEMVETEKEKLLLVKSVSASTVDQTVVIRVALDRSAEPKFSRLVGSGKLRIILDFENAVRIKGRVPDVIKSPSPDVTGIRIGAHPDKLRIVVDLNPQKTYSMNQHLFSRAYVLEIKPQS